MRLTAWASALPLSLLQWQFEPTLSPPRASLALPFPLSHGSPSKGAECRQSLVNSPMGNLPVLFLGLVPRQCPPKAKRKSRRHSGVKRKRVLLNVTHHIIWTRLWRSIPLRSPSSLRDNRGPASESGLSADLNFHFQAFQGVHRVLFPCFPWWLAYCLTNLYTPGCRVHKETSSSWMTIPSTPSWLARSTLTSGFILYKGAMASQVSLDLPS